MKKFTIYKILGVVAIVSLFIYSIIVVLNNSSKPAPPNGSGQNQNILSIPTKSGNVEVKNFTQKPAEQGSDYMLIEANNQFRIVYFQKDQAFLITLLAEPLQQVRQSAEGEFLKLLQVDETSACRLKVSLVIPYDVSASLSGQDYGLSFCPTGKSF